MTTLTGLGTTNNEKVMQCVLLTGSYYDSSGVPRCKARGYKGQQLVIDLTALPYGLNISSLEAGQHWWCEFRTNSWTLWKVINTTYVVP